MYALEEHTKIYVTEITETLSNVFGQTFLGHEPKCSLKVNFGSCPKNVPKMSQKCSEYLNEYFYFS